MAPTNIFVPGAPSIGKSRRRVLGGTAQTLLARPAGFTYSPPFNIYRIGSGSASTFTTDYNPLNKRPTPTATVYVDVNTGNNNNSGATPATAVRSISLGISMANALGGTVLVSVAPGDYKLSNTQTRTGQASLNQANIPDCWHVLFVTSNAPTCNIIIEPSDGEGTIRNIHDRAAVTFAATSDPNIYVASYLGTTAPCNIVPDPSFTDQEGFPIGMYPVWSVADVNNPWAEINAAWSVANTASSGNGFSKYSASGACFIDTTNKKVYVRRADNSAPGTAIKLYDAGAYAGMSANATATITLYLKNIKFWGGNQGLRLLANGASGFKVNCYTWNCAYLFNGNATTLGGFVAQNGGGELINYQDQARGVSDDAFAPYGSDNVTQANSFDRAEIGCKSRLTGSKSSLTVNGSTSHNLCRTVRVGSVHLDALDRVLHDINGTQSWDLGVTASNSRGPSGGTTAACFAVGQSGQSAPFATKWLDACQAVNGLNGAAQYATEAYTGGTLNYANLGFTPTAGDGTGTVQVYTP
jgi:hypothetical protein